jgi:hypothetical protein
MKIPTLFSVPLWKGRIKTRVVKKYLNSWPIHWFLEKENYYRFKDLKVGDLVNDCSGRNGEILEITPEYAYTRVGQILCDIDLLTTNAGCSLIHCGIEVGVSREQVEQRFIAFMDDWFFGEGGKTWYGGLDNPKYQDEINLAKRKYETVKSGGHITDERGCLLEKFKQVANGTFI